MSDSRLQSSEFSQPQAFLLGREGVLLLCLRGVCAGPFLAMLFVDRAWPWQASLPWLLAIALAPVGVICWQWAYWWVLRRMGARGPALGRAFNWSLAPLWLGAPGLALFYLNDFTHHLLWHVALAKILAAYVIVGITLALQVWVLDTAPALDRWPPLRLAMLFRQATPFRLATLFRRTTPFRHSRESGNPLLESWSQVWQLLRVHAALVILLAAGLALRLRDLLLEGGDVEHFYFYASTVFTKIHFLYYHLTRDLPWPLDQLATFNLIMAPLWRAAYHFDWPQILSIKIPTYTADVLSTIVVYALVLQAQRYFSGGVAGGADSESDGEASLSAPRLGLLVALVAAAVWYLHPWLLTATIDNAQSHAVALLFFVLAVARWEKPWLAGIFLALAASTRLEFGIAGIVAFFWYLRWRGVQDAGLYALTSLGLLGLIAVPYAAVDLTAFRWALGGHLLDRGEPLLLVQEIYEAFSASAPAWLNALDNRYVGLANAFFAILVMFDPSHRRALAKAGLFYILTLPVIHVRYLLFGWAALFLFAVPHHRRLLYLVPGLLWVTADIPRLWLLGTFLAVFVALFFTKEPRAGAALDGPPAAETERCLKP